MLTSDNTRTLTRLLVILAICRLLVATSSGIDNNRGDFYATLPGAYVQTLNPTLWTSPDLEKASGFGRAEYLYGPTQYWTILPLVFLDSYEALATWLLFIHLALIVLSAYFMWRSCDAGADGPPYARAAVFVSTCLFTPLLQAYGQREFEVFVLFVVSMAMYALVTQRESIAGALIGYITWFKFFPLAFLPYFVIRGWRRAALSFVVMSLALLAATELLLDLSRFRAVVELAGVEAQAAMWSGGFCEVWSDPNTRHLAVSNHTRAGVKWALCSFQDRWPWLSAQWTHAMALATILAGAAYGQWRLRRFGPRDTSDERWGRVLEVALVLSVPWLFLHAHYYYLLFLIVPLNALLVRYLARVARGESCKRLWLWALSYILLSALVVPTRVLSQLLGTDFWRLYMTHNVYFYGEAVLLGLLLWEYVSLPVRTANTSTARDASETPWFGTPSTEPSHAATFFAVGRVLSVIRLSMAWVRRSA